MTKLPSGPHSQDPETAWEIYKNVCTLKLGPMEAEVELFLHHAFYCGFQSGCSAVMTILSSEIGTIEKDGAIRTLEKKIEKGMKL